MNPSTRRIYSSERHAYDADHLPARKCQGREGRFASPAAVGVAEEIGKSGRVSLYGF
jgi:hypothetical protein